MYSLFFKNNILRMEGYVKEVGSMNNHKRNLRMEHRRKHKSMPVNKVDVITKGIADHIELNSNKYVTITFTMIQLEINRLNLELAHLSDVINYIFKNRKILALSENRIHIHIMSYRRISKLVEYYEKDTIKCMEGKL